MNLQLIRYVMLFYIPSSYSAVFKFAVLLVLYLIHGQGGISVETCVFLEHYLINQQEICGLPRVGISVDDACTQLSP